MKKTFTSIMALAAVLLCASGARAEQPAGWYVGAGVGVAMPGDPALRTDAKYGAKDENFAADWQGNVGYAWAKGLRLEGEFLHNQYNTKSVNGTPGFGHIINNALMLNAFFDAKTGTIFTPYIGAGLGPNFVNVGNVGSATSGFIDGSAVKLGYQAIAGVSAQLDKNWAVAMDYRYFGSPDAKVDATTGGKGRMDNASHNVMLGLRYSFDRPVPPPPPAPPVMPLPKVKATTPPVIAPRAAAKPPVAVVVPNFTVFFDFNKSTLTPEAKKIISAAAKEYERGGFVRITVTGHTDTVGTASYNQKLSERRAMAVESELKTLGVDSSTIRGVGAGKNDLLVPTADGVREAQNRRAEIVLAK